VGTEEQTLSVLGLGSCVAVVLYDKASRIGGLAHAMLPDPSYSSTHERVMKFVTTAVPELVNELVAAGAQRDRVTARLVGGASMFEELRSPEQPNIGERNVSAARTALAESGIRLVGEEIGGGHGRSIHFNLRDGSVLVSAHGRRDVCV
jgi:chemotaxis protein CheD